MQDSKNGNKDNLQSKYLHVRGKCSMVHISFLMKKINIYIKNYIHIISFEQQENTLFQVLVA